jgi:hypothetical protein
VTLWAILIATLDRRHDKLLRLLSQLLPQAEAARGLVRVGALWNRGERPVCQLRQELLDLVISKYVSFVDDDDEVPPYFVERVLDRLLREAPDYVGWRMQCWEGAQKLKPTFHSLRYERWFEDDSGFYRDISHLNPVRRELAAGTSFCAGWPEDRIWADQMRGRLVTESYIEDDMYFYYSSAADSVRSGIPGPSWPRPVVTSPAFSWHPASSQ